MSAVKIISARRIEEEEPRITLSFAGAPDDSDYREADHQRELHALDDALREDGMRVQARSDIQMSGSGGSWLTGEFLVSLATVAGPLGALAGAWITARRGRKVRIKVGEIEVEAANVEEANMLLKAVLKIKKKIDPKP